MNRYLTYSFVAIHVFLLLCTVNVSFLQAQEQVQRSVQRVFHGNVSQHAEFLPKGLESLVAAQAYEFFIGEQLPSLIKANVPFLDISQGGGDGSFEPAWTEPGEIPLLFKRLSEVRGEALINSKALLYKLQEGEWRKGYQRAVVRARSLARGQKEKEFRATWQRLYPSAFFPDKTVQLYREKIELHSPLPLSGYSLLHFAFATEDENALWMYSPLLKTVRALTESNLSDVFLNSDIAIDSYASWLPKAQHVELLERRQVRSYAAFVQPFLIKAFERDVCASIRRDGFRIWNKDTQRIPGAHGHLFSEALFLIRDVLRLSYGSKDPFSTYARVEFDVDSEFGFISYRALYDREDKLIKLELPAYAFLQLESVVYPVLLHKLIVDVENEKFVLIDYSELDVCLPDKENEKVVAHAREKLKGLVRSALVPVSGDEQLGALP